MTRAVMPAVVVCFIGLSLFPAHAAKVYIDEPRLFGHFIGDIITRRIIVELEPGGESVDPASIPRKGHVAYWLDLRDVNVDDKTDDAGRLSLDLEYQGFYSALQPKILEIPGFKLRVRSTEGSPRSVSVPPARVMFSPLREIVPETKPDNPAEEMRSDAAAIALPERAHGIKALLAAIAVCLSGLLLTHHYSVFPFRTRRSRPFTRAARQIAWDIAEDDMDDRRYRELLLVIHRAIDETVGRRVLPTDLNEVARNYAAIGENRTRVQEFFDASKVAFFSGRTSDARKELPATNLKRVIDDLASAERRFAI